MRKSPGLVFRLFVTLFLTLGLVGMMGTSAAAQASTVNCNGILEDGTIIQGDCEIELITETGVCQVTFPDGSIAQGQNNSACDALQANTCPSQVILDDGSILQITCDDGTGTDTDTDTGTDTDTDTQPAEELPNTGIGMTQQPGPTPWFLLAVASMLAIIGALAWHRRAA